MMFGKFSWVGVLGILALPLYAQVDTSSIELFKELDEVEVRSTDPGISLSKKAINTQELISEVELRKAACCDLSESFETNASISASFTDAVTGTRQIRLLGLEGPYALYTRGNLRTMEGTAAVLGLGFIPGAWIQSIQLTKGPGSVVNGASAMSGQINYELRPSFTDQIAHVNLFAGPGRLEQNLVYTWHQGKNWSSNIMVHGRQQMFRWDANEDGFLDAPLSNHIFVQNAWKVNQKNSEAQFGLKFSSSDNIGGNTNFGRPTLVPIWSHELNTDRYELWAKRGYFLKGGINRSIGTQLSLNYQKLDSYFGSRLFNTEEREIYGNLIFQDNISDTRHTFKGGLDFRAHDLNMTMWDYIGDYTALTTGIYGEYSFVTSPDGEGLSLIAGQRLDRLDLNDRSAELFYVPRLHLKYNSGTWSFRGQASRSYRYATLGAEYMGYMANNRHFTLPTTGNGQSGPAIESSWTLGTSVAHTSEVFFKDLQLSADVFLNKFDRKIGLDLDGSVDSGTFFVNEFKLSEWEQMPFALSGQLNAQYELLHRTMFKLSYRYQNVKQVDLQGAGLEQVILNVPHLVYLGASYDGRKGLGIEINATYNSSQRLPSVGYDERSPAFTILNLQVSKSKESFGQIYIGVQNLLNVRHLDPVIGNELVFDNPMSGRFDASVVWGPIMGRQLYAGWRYDIRKKKD